VCRERLGSGETGVDGGRGRESADEGASWNGSKGGSKIPGANWLDCCGSGLRSGLADTVSRLCKKTAKVVAESAVGKVRISLLRFCSIIFNHLVAS
jgi:hypothetical protein